MELKNGRPKDLTGRDAAEIRVYDLLDRLQIPYEYVDHAAAMTMDDCAEVDAILDAVICKNLFLCNRQHTKYYLLMMPGDKKFHTAQISSQIGSARLSFGSPEKMEEFLDLKYLKEMSKGLEICCGCFTGSYPMDPPTEDIRGEYQK